MTNITGSYCINPVTAYASIITQGSTATEIPSGDFHSMLDKKIGQNMAQQIRDSYHVLLNISTTESNHWQIGSCDLKGTNHVWISQGTLNRMEQDTALKNKVLTAIEEFSSIEHQAATKALSPPVKSSGMLVYPDGSCLYWVEGYPNEESSNNGEKSTQDSKVIYNQKYTDIFHTYEMEQQNVISNFSSLSGYAIPFKARFDSREH